ncbi:MAG: FliH/SctL family protein [bacterium]
MLIKNDQEYKLKAIRQHSLPKVTKPRQKPLKKKPVEPARPRVDQTKQRLREALFKIETLEDELAREREKRFQEGLQAGRKEGYEQGVDEVKTHIEKFAHLVAEIQGQQHTLLERLEQFVVDLAFRMVERMVGCEQVRALRLDREYLLEMVREVASQFAETSKVIFRVHEKSAAIIEASRQQIQDSLPESISVVVVEDPSLNPCDCMIESDFGVLDGCIETKLRQIERAFAK